MRPKHNITVAIEPSLLKRARAVAARRGRSVSALLADELRHLVADDAGYAAARKRALALLAAPLSLGGSPLKRSGERRVGEEGRSRWAPDHLKKKKNKKAAGERDLKT